MKDIHTDFTATSILLVVKTLCIAENSYVVIYIREQMQVPSGIQAQVRLTWCIKPYIKM